MRSDQRSTWSSEVSLLCAPASPSQARGFVRDELSARDLQHLTDDVELVVSELATNAVVHAQTPFLVTLQGDGGTLVLTVQDQAPSSRPRMWRSSPEATGGRGLLITELISDAWGVGTGSPMDKTVWASFATAVRSPPEEAAGDDHVVQ